MPATSNEQFQDALLRRQIALSHFERGLTSDILELLDKTEKDIRATLADRLSEIEGKDIARATTRNRIEVLARAIEKIRAGALDEAQAQWTEAMEQMATAEAEYLDHNLKDVSPVKLDTVLPDPAMLASIVASQPIQGRPLSKWLDGLSEQDTQRIMDAVNIGMVQGETTDDIIRRVVGSRSMDGADGVLQITRNDIASITQTTISTISNEARQQYYEANDDIFSKEQWVATLDDATCEYCGDLDGEEFAVGEGEQPPAHFNCRCVRVAVIDGSALGDRPANAAYEDELDGLDKGARADRIKELVGQVPETTRYEDWLNNQTAAFQDHVLGPTRGELFRNGDLPLSKFVNINGDRISLDQLRQREPAAFKRAGL